MESYESKLSSLCSNYLDDGGNHSLAHHLSSTNKPDHFFLLFRFFATKNTHFPPVTMAPDADKLRHRKTGIGKKEEDAATQERISTIKGLGPTEVAIDGVIYDLKDFEHPGGESIMVFGGNDVTATSKHLEKMNGMIALQSDSFW